MHPAELAILLHRALEVRAARLRDLLATDGWSAQEEPLHQVRVSARRLGAVLDLVDPEAYPGHKPQRRALKALVDLLGLPRELDVHAAYLRQRHPDARTPCQAAVIEHLLEQVDRGRAKARKAMHRDLDRLRLPDPGKLLEVPALPNPFQAASLQEAAWACLGPRIPAALGGLGDLALKEEAGALHKARVRIKKLRYAIEALEGAFPDSPEPLLASLRALQARLGEHHDLATLEAYLWATEAALRAQDRATLCGGVLDLLGDVAESRRAVFEAFALLAGAEAPGAFGGLTRAGLGLPPLGGEGR